MELSSALHFALDFTLATTSNLPLSFLCYMPPPNNIPILIFFEASSFRIACPALNLPSSFFSLPNAAALHAHQVWNEHGEINHVRAIILSYLWILWWNLFWVTWVRDSSPSTTVPTLWSGALYLYTWLDILAKVSWPSLFETSMFFPPGFSMKHRKVYGTDKHSETGNVSTGGEAPGGSSSFFKALLGSVSIIPQSLLKK